MDNNPLKAGYIVFGLLFFVLGVIGTVLPLIPTTPLIVLAAVCFAKSSKKLHFWFVSTRIYRKTIDGFVRSRTMTLKAKIILLTTITAVMSLSFAVMIAVNAPLVIRIILAVVWLLHVLYFGFKVKTVKTGK